MTTIQKLRNRLTALKIEKADIVAELQELNPEITRLANSGNSKARLAELSRKRGELASDQTSVDAEILQVNARLMGAEIQERHRDQHVAGVRAFACAIISRGNQLPPSSEVISLAIDLEAALQEAIPAVENPDLPRDEEEDQ